MLISYPTGSSDLLRSRERETHSLATRRVGKHCSTLRRQEIWSQAFEKGSGRWARCSAHEPNLGGGRTAYVSKPNWSRHVSIRLVRLLRDWPTSLDSRFRRFD